MPAAAVGIPLIGAGAGGFAQNHVVIRSAAHRGYAELQPRPASDDSEGLGLDWL